MKNRIVWIFKIDQDIGALGIGFMGRKLVWCQYEKIEHISLGDSVGKLWILKKLAQEWGIPILSDESGFTIWTHEIGFAFSKSGPHVIDEEEAKSRGKYLNPRAKRKMFRFLEPKQKMFQPN